MCSEWNSLSSDLTEDSFSSNQSLCSFFAIPSERAEAWKCLERSSTQWLATSLYSVSIYKVLKADARLSLSVSWVSLFASLATSSFLVRWTRWCCLFSWKEMETLLFRRASSGWQIDALAARVSLTSYQYLCLMMKKSIWCQWPERGCLQVVLKLSFCVNSQLVMTSCFPAHRVSKRVPFEFSFPISWWPSTLYHVVWSDQTRALKSPNKNNLSECVTDWMAWSSCS